MSRSLAFVALLAALPIVAHAGPQGQTKIDITCAQPLGVAAEPGK